MNCSTCGSFLAESVNICPRCGTPTVNYPRNATPYDPTLPASYVRQQPPSTSYGPEQHVPPPPPQYSIDGPYAAHPQPSHNNMPPFQPPPSKKARKGPNVALIVGLVLLLIILIWGGLALRAINKQSGSQTAIKVMPTTTPTPDPAKNPYPPETGTLTISDPMNDNSKGYNWNESTTPLNGGGSEICSFSNGAYHITRTQRGSLVCPAGAPDLIFANVVCEAKLTVTQGEYSGIAFRINRPQETGYVFAVGVASDYAIDTFNFKVQGNKEYTILRKGSNTAIKRGWKQTNLVAIVANGASISVYVNNQFIAQVQDNTYTQGEIGFYGYGQTTEDVMTKDVRVWQI